MFVPGLALTAVLARTTRRLPLTTRALQSGGSTVPVILTLGCVASAAGLLAVVAYTLPAAATPRGPALTAHRATASIFAVHATVTDAICWSCSFSSAVSRRAKGESLLGDSRSGLGDRRPSVNEAMMKETAEGPGGCSAWCASHKRIKAMYTNPDWFSCWIGTAYFIACAVAVGLGGNTNVIPTPATWNRNPVDSLAGAGIFNMSGFNGAGVIDGIVSLLFLLVCMLLTLAPAAELCNAGGCKKVLPAFCFVFFIAAFSRILGAQERSVHKQSPPQPDIPRHL